MQNIFITRIQNEKDQPSTFQFKENLQEKNIVTGNEK